MLSLVQAPEDLGIAGPVIFLAGPIQWGGASWHAEARALLARHPGGFHVASPRRDIESAGDFTAIMSRACLLRSCPWSLPCTPRYRKPAPD